MSSITSNAPEEYIKTLVLSYNHLPNHLKPCFLYFAAFPEDYEIPAWKLILLWVAEGLVITQIAENSLEEVAAAYLKDLISRSLVMVSKTTSTGGIKTCIVHDVLRDLCIKKAKEVNFFHQMPDFREVDKKNIFRQLERFSEFDFEARPTTTDTVQRLYSREVDEDNFTSQLEMFSLSTHMVHGLSFSIRRVQTILAYNGSGNSFPKARYAKFYILKELGSFKSLRVMDLSCIGLSNFPIVIGNLFELRYIALCIDAADYGILRTCLATLIHKLECLETLIVQNRMRDAIEVPKEIWMSHRLRHLILKGNIGNTDIDYSYLSSENLQTLSHMQTLSLRIPLELFEKILEITPNLRKLGIYAALYYSFKKLTISNLDKLQHLESLTVQNDLDTLWIPTENRLLYKELSGPGMFPVTLKKLTLVCTFLKWDEMQKIGMLPNLEVLKLQCEAFHGERWETSDGGFCRLKHLAFKYIKIVQWSAYSDQFPNLQHLKLDECLQLQGIPIGIGDIYTLEMIEIRNCNSAVVQSAHKIKEDQLEKGNDMLKISIFQA